MRVEQIMTTRVDVCRPEDTLETAARVMWEDDCGCVPVVASDRVVGMLTDRDICMASYTQGRVLSAIRVRDVMSKDVRSCSPEASCAEAETIMRSAQVRRLPVVDPQGRLVGLVSLADLARAIESKKKSKRQQITEQEVAGTLAEICLPRHLPT